MYDFYFTEALFIALFINAMLSLPAGFLAKSKGRSFVGYYALGFLLSFLVALIVVAAVPSLKSSGSVNGAFQNQPRVTAWTHKRCHFCKEQILAEATICRYCKLEQPEVVLTEEQLNGVRSWCPSCRQEHQVLPHGACPDCGRETHPWS